MAKYHNAIREMVKTGYKPDDEGNIYTPYGNTISGKLYGTQRYSSMSVPKALGLNNISVPIHKFNAYYWFGEEAFLKCVRHLNSDRLDNSRSNLLLGTHSENEQDKSKHVRVRVAKYARSCQPKIPYNSKLTMEQVEVIRKLYSPYLGSKAPNGFTLNLAKYYGVSRTVIHKVVKGYSYND